MAADGVALVEARAGVTFGVQLYVPWDAPEAMADVSSEGVVPLSIPDVIGLVGRCEGAAESRVLQGRDARSVRVLVPDCRGVDCRYGGYARVAGFYSGVVDSQSTMASGGPQSHGVAPERTGGDAIGS